MHEKLIPSNKNPEYLSMKYKQDNQLIRVDLIRITQGLFGSGLNKNKTQYGAKDDFLYPTSCGLSYGWTDGDNLGNKRFDISL